MINFTPQYLLLYNLANGYMNYYSLTKNKFLNGKNIIIEIKNLFKKDTFSKHLPYQGLAMRRGRYLGGGHWGLGGNGCIGTQRIFPPRQGDNR